LFPAPTRERERENRILTARSLNMESLPSLLFVRQKDTKEMDDICPYQSSSERDKERVRKTTSTCKGGWLQRETNRDVRKTTVNRRTVLIDIERTKTTSACRRRFLRKTIIL